jgi:hypothetical protein
MTDWNAVSAFMGAVIAWPGTPQDPGFVNLQYSYVDKKTSDGKRGGKYPVSPGKPFKDLTKLVSYAGWLNTTANNKDVWFCTSLQSESGVNKRGNLIGKRSAQNALLQKSIWIDMDVGANDPKKYPTVEAALAAVIQFQKDVGLPQPSSIVFSGGGIHVYWISNTPLTPAEWQPYASGLKNLLISKNILCDSWLTTDIARILRVPGTFNHKYDPPELVRLSPLPLTLYDFANLDFLKQFAGQVAAPGAQTPTHSIFVDGKNFANFSKPSPLFDAFKGEPGLDAGIGKFTDTLLDPRPIFDGCGFLREAQQAGGANYGNPLWNLSVLCSAFMENGNAIAHEISRGHANYTHAETQQQFERKLADKDRGVGWPSCAAIQSNGCGACAACPHFGKITSPLKLGTVGPKPNQGDGTAQQTPNAGKESAGSEDEWPDGYARGGAPVKGYANTLAAFRKLGIKFTLDTFRQKEFSEGHEIELLNGELSDRTVTMLRDQVRRECGFYPDKETAREAIIAECYRNRINPVTKYFDGLKWDGVERLPKLLHEYLGAEDTPLNAAISVKLMCAIVRRSKRPGCKYDQKVVLQGGQGVRKSMFCEDLAVFPDLFTDAGDLSGSIKEQMEITQGKQIIEFAELAGFSQNSRERNKGNLSRRVDRARLAYAHYAKDEPRSSVPIGTTNPGGYLKDPTGERRYWHVAVNKYDRDKFLADKDPLYAEAVMREPKEKLWLDTPELVKAHDAIVATAKEPNALVDDLADLAGEVWEIGRDKMAGGWLIHREERVSNKEVRCKLGIFGIEALRMRDIGTRISDAMMTLGWTKATGTLVCKHGGDPEGGYRRQMPDGYELDPEPTAQEMDAS